MTTSALGTPCREESRQEANSDAYDWRALAQVNATDLRNNTNPETIEKFHYDFADEVIRKTNNQAVVLYVEAQLVADTFMSAVKSVNELPDNDDQRTFVRPHIRLTEYNTIDIAWIKMIPGRFAITGPISKGQKVFYRVINGKKIAFPAKALRIKKGQSQRYKKSLFKGEPDWVIQLIDLCEDKFEILRSRSEKLSKIRNAVYEFTNLTTKFYNETIGENETRSKARIPADYRTSVMESSAEKTEFEPE